jgi:hypothetical protein
MEPIWGGVELENSSPIDLYDYANGRQENYHNHYENNSGHCQRLPGHDSVERRKNGNQEGGFPKEFADHFSDRQILSCRQMNALLTEVPKIQLGAYLF